MGSANPERDDQGAVGNEREDPPGRRTYCEQFADRLRSVAVRTPGYGGYDESPPTYSREERMPQPSRMSRTTLVVRISAPFQLRSVAAELSECM